MTNTELMKTAAEYFEKGSRNKDDLDSPHLRECVAVYFKVKPHGSCMVVLDKSTGEPIHSICTMRDALLPEYGPDIWMANEARTLVEESQQGMWDKFPEGGSEPTLSRADLAKELERRWPGQPSADYEHAIAEAFQRSYESRRPSQ